MTITNNNNQNLVVSESNSSSVNNSEATRAGSADEPKSKKPKLAKFSEEKYLVILDNLIPTQDSINTVSKWIIDHSAHHEIICQLWLKKLNDKTISSDQKLALFYLANDVIQNCKKKNALVFQKTFREHIIEAIKLVCQCESIVKKVERVLDVWIERNVYEIEFVQRLIRVMEKDNLFESSSDSLESSPENIDYFEKSNKSDSSLTVNTPTMDEIDITKKHSKEDLEKIISEFQAILNNVSLAKSEVDSTRVIDINSDNVKQYRDRIQCIKFKNQFENSCNMLENYTKKLKEQAEQRKTFIKFLEEAEIFYDAQFNDAKTVQNAYKVYGGKVNTMKKKLDEFLSTN